MYTTHVHTETRDGVEFYFKKFQASILSLTSICFICPIKTNIIFFFQSQDVTPSIMLGEIDRNTLLENLTRPISPSYSRSTFVRREWSRRGRRILSCRDEPIKFGRYRFVGNSIFVDGRDAEESSYRYGWNTPREGCLRAKGSDEQTHERRNYSKNHYRRSWNFHTFRNFFAKAFTPDRGKYAAESGEGVFSALCLSVLFSLFFSSPLFSSLPFGSPFHTVRRRLKRQKEQEHEQLFDFRTTLPLSREPRNAAKRVADCSYCPRRSP